MQHVTKLLESHQLTRLDIRVRVIAQVPDVATKLLPYSNLMNPRAPKAAS